MRRVSDWRGAVVAGFLVLGCSEEAGQPVRPETPAEPTTPTQWASTDSSEACLPIVKNAGTYGVRADLPSGFAVYNCEGAPGLFVQNLHDTQRWRVPNTRGDMPAWVCIDDSGTTVFYYDMVSRQAVYVRPDGSGRGRVPLTYLRADQFPPFGVWRRGPNGFEIFYQADSVTVRAVKLVAEGDRLRAVDDRVILDLSAAPNRAFLLCESLAIAGDGMAGKYFAPDSGSLYWGALQLRIPAGGLGTATFADVVQWENAPPDLSGSCGYAVSHDGTLLVHNVGDFRPPDMCECVAHNHKGFCVVPFERGPAPVSTHTYLRDYGYSVNWCPPEYRAGDPPLKNDFNRWYFGNSNDYVVGTLSGVETETRGVWLVEWRTNTWTSVTPRYESVPAYYAAVHFGRTIDPLSFVPDTVQDTTRLPPIDLNDPRYEVVCPNGGEVWRVGDTCEVKVRSYRHANAVLLLSGGFGEFSFRFPGTETSFDPRVDSLFRLVVPDSFPCLDCIPGSNAVPARGSGWSVVVADYSGTYRDESDSAFVIE